ncbi:helix-turn-helix transcriptional regulator [Mesorhizobium sp. CA18]|uniref:helix-turn-helix transcriptional regulator n=1 Tax=unclassified Mesorhizobium TaxID=325217 RepID=UPI000BAEECEC|nr:MULTISPECIES: helix-turn-helix transcriptional regulator [unclassified Mesorhizobium]MBZ9735772.1 helix-turn-helix transcriptional regulator [Mesorhizobium sp. CA9]MBZ9765542.1 helix-turn-helix transcriptional regulator [Mesorhizobium sp. CA6]MBZ9827628.1 helix-turn-helix transcriptional regulator [Mesorhizobium sp. CA18]MBZ9833329.1 helix-turn-helix transcriptional regulator [Mesorhizobium sp. CA2]MBZ9839660.1 helix-turn-helix transcriptional regulator [Mesorhizobium sp. CA3]
MANSAAQAVARPEPAIHRLTVLVALADAQRAEQLADALAASDDLAPALAGSGVGQMADVAIADEAGLEGWVVSSATPIVLLSRRAGSEQVADNVLAVLPASADGLLIAAAARLAASGYRVGRAAPSEAHGDFHDDEPAEEETPDDNQPRPALSPREAEVLALLAEGAPNKVIARRLNISVHTAKFHVAAILIKLGAANRTDAIAIAMRQGLVLV